MPQFSEADPSHFTGEQKAELDCAGNVVSNKRKTRVYEFCAFERKKQPLQSQACVFIAS